MPRDPFLPSADVGEGFDARELDVNLKGARFTARIGLGFLRRGCGGGEEYCWVEGVYGVGRLYGE